MKTVFIGINGYDFPYTRVRCFHFAEELQKLGMETEVLSYRDHLAPQYSGIEMLNLGDREKLRLNFKAFLKLFKSRKSVFYVQKIHYHSAAPFLMSRIAGTKFILDYDDWDIDRSPLFRRNFLNQIFFKGKDAEEITKTIAKSAAACIASSRYLEKFLLQCNEKTFYIPTGVKLEKFRRSSPRSSDSINFVWTGLVWGEVIYNNVIFLIECFSVLNQKYKNICLKIIGQGNWFPKIKDTVERLYKNCRIEFINWVDPDKIPEVLSGCHIGLLPLIPDKANEIWMISKSPTKLFEYMAMELATVSSHFGEASNIIQEGVDGFLGRNKEDFIKEMEILVKDNILREQMGKNARKKIEEQFSIPVLAKKLYSIIKDIGDFN
ncbi:MAG: hypothetical protein A2042_04215 [Candidatus Schekmanbacteria bacterium GWA2_38_11]|uniref:Glycosyl transferase family 1 domain-containing protein n=1 Tax=Candidatus Schekmanbacteria bacterium GWA2_38_11 TaxID=1817876 RepID=A0A1F7RN15_9BACT|nr:MAG: hypothetical protein A2042_04215 [Candidatus Schekmanbacteria bacterium GWA2_38_11]